MRNVLSRQRIQGISLNRKTPSTARNSAPRVNIENNSSDALALQKILNSKPIPFSNSDIHRLLGDMGRTELQHLVSETIESISHWRQALRRIEKSELKATNRWDWDANDSKFEKNVQNYSLTVAQTLELEVRAQYRVWKHRLEVLELIASGQSSVHWEIRNNKRHKRPL